ncbi:MAG: thioredoxin family protein [Chloroflexota bacterium]
MPKLQIGSKAIPFSLPGVDDVAHSLADYADNELVIVGFSCNHCPYAQAWEGRMRQIQADYADKSVQLIVISSNDATKFPADSFTAMQAHAKDRNFNYPYLYDESQEVARFYGAERTPEFFVFDKKGILQYHGALDDNYEVPEAVQHHYLRNALDALLAGQTPTVAETPAVGCTIKWL